MHQWDTVAVVGVGMIGGSIGLALRKRKLARQVIGIGRSAASLRKAKRREAVDATTTNLPRGVADAELVVVCTPVATIVDRTLEAAANCPAGALITDAGSTKAHIVEQLTRDLPGGAVFVGSHPLAGSEKAGPQHAVEDLLVGRQVVVTPTRRTLKNALAKIQKFWKSLGAKVTLMSPREHDQALAAVSHTPHLVAAALAAATDDRHLPLAATGWCDTTRIAAGDAELWQQIVLENRAHVLKSLGKFERVLSELRAAVERGDAAKLAKILQAGKHARDAVGN